MTARKYDLDTMLADLRAGDTYKDIAAAHGVFLGTVQQVALRHNLRRNRRKAPPPPPPERDEFDYDNYPEPTEADALPKGGAWELDPRRRILTWKETAA